VTEPNRLESELVLNKGTWVTFTGGRVTLMPPPTVRTANFCCKAATCWGVDMRPDWSRPVNTLGWMAAVGLESTDIVVVAMEPDPCTPEVEAMVLF
jgi:hypothetical protein